MKKRVKTVADAIEALGGTGEIARTYNIRSQAVANWRLKNKIPESYRLRIYIALKALGIEPDVSIVGDASELIDEIEEFRNSVA